MASFDPDIIIAITSRRYIYDTGTGMDIIERI